jgi:hypothetical protein
MDQQAVYDQVDLDKPWDDPANAFLAETVIPAYNCPSLGDGLETTCYVAVVDPAGIFVGDQAIKFQEIVDGLSNTVLVVETSAAHAVPWMSPQDIDRATFMQASGATTHHAGGANATIADGSVKFLASSMDPQVRQELVTRAGQDASPSF